MDDTALLGMESTDRIAEHELHVGAHDCAPRSTRARLEKGRGVVHIAQRATHGAPIKHKILEAL